METGPYAAPFWLPGGHLQTLYPALLLRGPRIDYRRERWELDDGDFLDADWLDGPDTAPLLVLFHGLEGNSARPYARNLMQAARRLDWRSVVVHFRGCSGEPNRLPRAYFAGDSAEIGGVFARLRRRFPAISLHAVGISLGGNALLKWLGEAGSEARKFVARAAAVCAPLDMNAAGNALDQGFNRRVYTAHFLATLKKKSLDKARRFPGLLDADAIRRATTFREFDTLVTAKLHGFRDAEDYWTQSSSRPLLRHIAVPTLVLNARNDPFLPASALPCACEVSGSVSLLQPAGGGHVGFPAGAFPGHAGWMPQCVFAFLNRP
ncbi:MAG: alpha/beta fold hydrolase [Pseudomonadota bacterium]